MHYYQFNIGDYTSHTAHLDPLEDIAYRRMIDWCYLHEKALPLDIDEIARLIRMRSHNECIAYVLETYFVRSASGYANQRVSDEISKYNDKADKARKSAKARWEKQPAKNKGLSDANALRTQCEGNANHKPLTNNHKPIEKKAKAKAFTPPHLNEVLANCHNETEAIKFVSYYESNGWKVGRNKMKDWKSALRGWMKRAESYASGNSNMQTYEQRLNDIDW